MPANQLTLSFDPPPRLCRKCGGPRTGRWNRCAPCVTAYNEARRRKSPEQLAAERTERLARAAQQPSLQDRPCSRCRINARQRNNPWCSKCHRAYERAYYLAHPDKAAARMAKQNAYQRESQRYRDTARACRERNRARLRPKYAENSRRWYYKHREHAKQVAAKSRAKHRDQRNADTRAWIAKNRQRMKEHAHLRRVRQHGVHYERVSYAAIRRRDRDICYICEQPVTKNELAFDHVIPLCKGGPHAAINLRVTHQVCNLRKGRRVVSFFEKLIAERAS